MAGTNAIDKIAVEFVAAILAGWNGDLAFESPVLLWLRTSEVDQVDVLEIVEDGVTTNVEKETPDAVLFDRTGATVLGTRLRVTLSFNPHLPYLCVKGVQIL